MVRLRRQRPPRRWGTNAGEASPHTPTTVNTLRVQIAAKSKAGIPQQPRFASLNPATVAHGAPTHPPNPSRLPSSCCTTSWCGGSTLPCLGLPPWWLVCGQLQLPDPLLSRPEDDDGSDGERQPTITRLSFHDCYKMFPQLPSLPFTRGPFPPRSWMKTNYVISAGHCPNKAPQFNEGKCEVALNKSDHAHADLFNKVLQSLLACVSLPSSFHISASIINTGWRRRRPLPPGV